MINANVIFTGPDAAWVMFFHGFGGSSTTWQKQTEDYSKHYNLLLFNFHDNPEQDSGPLSIEKVCGEIAAIMDRYHVPKAHLVSMSSNSLLALPFVSLYPERVGALVMAGGIISFHFKTNFLLESARILQSIIPYMPLYKLFAYIIMPGKNHLKSRMIFVREAIKLGHTEFCCWINFLSELKKNEAYLSEINHLPEKKSFLYIMGNEDHLFKTTVLKDISKIANASMVVLPDCGHVCNIEKVEMFNQISLNFLDKKPL
ncbi:MAG: alpha/beta hydrolase [Eubacteriales bacterium]|nr:alpha/beta hydrolase [Eubacteriales bacterium]MDD4421895.1 alpha/beta hydrolase [Eubacteriales bacterium]HBR32348.1 alpha/beta hydrolase [Clostridiales bacterium]